MPFSAEVSNGDEVWRRVDITTMETPKLDLLDYRKRCPDEDCHAEMIVKHGPFVVAHFAHKADSVSSRCVFAAGGPESREHQIGKRELMGWLRIQPEYKASQIEPERILRIGATKRIADIYVTNPDGTVDVHEVQLAKTTIEECRQRTSDYKDMGVSGVWWWFGGANRDDRNLFDWANRECAAGAWIEIDREIVGFRVAVPSGV